MKNISKQLQIGKAGEYLVCADLILKGFVAYLSEQGLPYDLLLDTGERLLKVQVKTTSKPVMILQRTNEYPAYLFKIKRATKTGNQRYTEKEIDLFALVVLDTKEIGYMWNNNIPTNINFRCSAFRGLYYDEQHIKISDTLKKLKESGLRLRDIVKETGLNYTTCSTMSQKHFKPFQSTAKYMSDIAREPEWFTATQP
jgi:hypothetical protein